MKLVNYGVGEISDRLTILALKLLHAGAAETTHWKTEQTTLLNQLRSREKDGKWFDGYTELAAVNAALWYAEDALRALRNDPPTVAAAHIAFRIQELNDRRAGLIAQINKEVGDFTGQEKL